MSSFLFLYGSDVHSELGFSICDNTFLTRSSGTFFPIDIYLLVRNVDLFKCIVCISNMEVRRSVVRCLKDCEVKYSVLSMNKDISFDFVEEGAEFIVNTIYQKKEEKKGKIEIHEDGTEEWLSWINWEMCDA